MFNTLNLTAMTRIFVEKIELVHVNRKSVTLKINNKTIVYATQKVANQLLQEVYCDRLFECFIINKEYRGASIQWIAVPSIFG